MANHEFSPTWVYFFARADKATKKALGDDSHCKWDAYRVDAVRSVRGKLAGLPPPGSKLTRLESGVRRSFDRDTNPSALFTGVTGPLHYTSRAQRDDLGHRSRSELTPTLETVSVLIPIRKSASWWGLAHDERHQHFQALSGQHGHTAIGAAYAERLYRKLYHAGPDLGVDYDFLTYFEFERSRVPDFENLLAELRNEERNPEWSCVESEQEIWMTRVAK